MAGPSVLEVAAGQLVHVRELTVPARARANRDITTHVSNTFVTSHPASRSKRGSCAMTSTEPALRRAGRVLVIDPAGRVLLLQGFDPAEPDSPFWFTIGGGLDEGEHSAQAALRELREEAGIVAAAISSRARSGGAAPNPDGHQQPPPGYQPYSPQQGYQRPGQMPWPGPQQARPARRSHTARNV